MRASERPLESFKELGYRGHSWSLELHRIQPYSGTTSDQGRHGFPSIKDPIKSQIRNLLSRFLFSLSSGPPLQSLISLFQWISSFKSLSIQGQLLAIKFDPRQPHLIRQQAASLSRKSLWTVIRAALCWEQTQLQLLHGSCRRKCQKFTFLPW